MKYFGLMILGVSLLLSACADPAANKPKAQTSVPSANSPAKSDQNDPSNSVLASFNAKGTEIAIDPSTSAVEFTGSKVTGKHDGGFKTFKGLIDLVNNSPAESRVAFEIEMVSVFTDADGLTKHLQTGDFFDVADHPRSSFVSSKIVPDAGKGKAAYVVTGDLELRGTRRSITFPATIEIGDKDVSVDSEFSINRRDFGIVYAGKADDLIRDDVVLRLKLKGSKK